MQEYSQVRQIPGEARRRWFASAELDLIVFISEDHELTGFDLCYDKTGIEHAIMWSKTRGYSHMAVDDGEHTLGRHKQTPIMVADGFFDIQSVYNAFLNASRSLPEVVANFVLRTLEQHPDFPR